jgi:SAM-dependent methyltransferase
MDTTTICPLCAGKANRTYEGLIGYIEGKIYDLYECENCEASFANPLKSDDAVYNHIYSQPERIPGYERYVRYSKLVKQVSKPLDALSNAENTYWSIREALKKSFDGKDVTIAEIGSGLGYLTYSLNKAGYRARGIDISSEAVAKAKAAYGDYYEAGDIVKLSESYKGRFDCVVMTELIEHVEDPKAFIVSALNMLKEGGKLIITTPNKSWTPKGYVWGSDVPPIHLWWFSEKSIIEIAKSLGKKCSLLDFTPFTSRFYEPLWYPTMEDFQSDLPKITREGKYIGKLNVEDFKSRFLSIKARYWLSLLRRSLKRKHVSSRASTMCAILS